MTSAAATALLDGVCTWTGALLLLIVAALVVLGIFLYSVFAGVSRNVTGLREGERSYVDPSTSKTMPFPPSFSSPATKSDDIYLSAIFPAYNEEERMPGTIEETLEYLKARQRKDPSFTWEIIIVDDGSKDKTYELAQSFAKREGCDKVRVLKLVQNRGKGGAVKCGMLVARGKYMLMADSDNATQFRDVEKLEAACARVEKNGFCIGVGSRAHLEQEAVAERTIFRNFLMWGFHFLVRFVGGIHGIKDTQCGFKLFSRRSASLLFPNQHVERWCFDIELLFLAARFGMPAVEVSVHWQEIPGSKLDPLGASLQMFRDLFRIRLFYLLRLWKIEKTE